MGYYIATKNVENRMTKRVIDQVFDDNQDGVADVEIVADTIADAENYVESCLRRNHSQASLDAYRKLGPKVPRALIRLSLDAFEYMCYARHPDYIRGDWKDRRKLLDRQLKDFADAQKRADTQAGAPAPDNTGGIVEANDQDCPLEEQQVFLDTMGIFSL